VSNEVADGEEDELIVPTVQLKSVRPICSDDSEVQPSSEVDDDDGIRDASEAESDKDSSSDKEEIDQQSDDDESETEGIFQIAPDDTEEEIMASLKAVEEKLEQLAEQIEPKVEKTENDEENSLEEETAEISTLDEAAECISRIMDEIVKLEAASDERAARGSCDAGERPPVLATPAAEGAVDAEVGPASAEDASCASGGGGFTSYVMITQQQGKETCPAQEDPPEEDSDRVNVSVLDAEKININHTTKEEEEEAAEGGFLTLHLQNEVQIVSNDKTMSQVRIF
jgi:hypothetical protein